MAMTRERIGDPPAGVADDPRAVTAPTGRRVALLGYRGDPRCGGQGVYLRHLGRELALLGHDVTVVSGPPYPELDEVHGPGRLRLRQVPSLGWNPPPVGAAEAPPVRVPRDRIDLVEAYRNLYGGFGEPDAFMARVHRLLLRGIVRAEVVHDNQALGAALGAIRASGWPVLATVHHPLDVDRDSALARAEDPELRRRLERWWSFVDVQSAGARELPRVLTVSASSAEDAVAMMGLDRERISVVPVGTDPTVFAPRPDVAEVPGRLVAICSADVPVKGLDHLLEALAIVRRTRPGAHLVVVSRVGPTGATADALVRLGLGGAVRFASGLSDDELVHELVSAEVAVVPSLYEGFSLPAVEAMACGTALVATTGGALPEVVGPDGVAGILVPPAEPVPLAAAIERVLEDPVLRARLGRAGRRRVEERFTWRRCAEVTAGHYEQLLADRAARRR